MFWKGSLAVGLFTACMAGLSACAVNEPAQAASGDPAPMRAELLLAALEDAEAATKAQDGARLDKALRTIAMLGAKPLTSHDEQRLASWRAASAGDEGDLRGRTLGPAFRSGSVAAGGSAIIEQTFYGGTPASVSLRVPEGSPLRLRVIDKSNRRVCEQSARKVMCRWLPLYTQSHRIELVNERATNARYYLVFD
ncbi:MAG: hypothetical protein SXU28_03955 [Pseudomonadota bacterium]|nr:hypothetical protein [Pseudomonadota bacterium]